MRSCRPRFFFFIRPKGLFSRQSLNFESNKHSQTACSVPAHGRAAGAARSSGGAGGAPVWRGTGALAARGGQRPCHKMRAGWQNTALLGAAQGHSLFVRQESSAHNGQRLRCSDPVRRLYYSSRVILTARKCSYCAGADGSVDAELQQTLRGGAAHLHQLPRGGPHTGYMQAGQPARRRGFQGQEEGQGKGTHASAASAASAAATAAPEAAAASTSTSGGRTVAQLVPGSSSQGGGMPGRRLHIVLSRAQATPLVLSAPSTCVSRCAADRLRCAADIHAPIEGSRGAVSLFF